jgi:hypothetical protein
MYLRKKCVVIIAPLLEEYSAPRGLYFDFYGILRNESYLAFLCFSKTNLSE